MTSSTKPPSAAAMPGGARQHSVASGGSPKCTPANLIAPEEFRSMFTVKGHEKEEDFFGRLEKQKQSSGSTKSPGRKAAISLEEIIKALKDRKSTENDFRDSMKGWFDVYCGGGSFASAALLNDGESEGAIETILKKYIQKRRPESKLEPNGQFPIDPRGMLITAKSMQALALYVSSSGVLFEGELKHDKKYNIQAALRQCAGYLFGQLWWFRTHLGLNVKEVHGFVMCSGRCKGVDRGTVDIGLVTLRVPQTEKFCQKCELHVHRVAKPFTDDDASISTLLDPLSKFFSFEFPDPFKADRIGIEYVLPGGMMLPSQLPAQSGWSIVPTGAASLVLKCDNFETVVSLLSPSVSDHDKENLSFLLEETEDETYYLKFRNLGTGQFWQDSILERA